MHFRDLAAPFWRIYCNFNDSAKIVSEGKEYKLSPRKVFLISPDTSYSADNNALMDQFYLHFQASAPFDICPGIIMVWEDDEQIMDIIDDLTELLAQDETPNMEISMRMSAADAAVAIACSQRKTPAPLEGCPGHQSY